MSLRFPRWLVTKQAFERVFRGGARKEDCELVLARLAEFCRATKTTHVEGDALGSAQLEGRRQVWLLVREHLDLTPEEVSQMLAASRQGDSE